MILMISRWSARMARPKLEVASWIAGITSALIAAYALFPSRPSTEAAVPANTSQGTSPKESTSTVPSLDAQKPTAAQPQPSSIADALAAAKQIYGTTTRDNELERLARLAISRHEFGAAMEATRSIYGTTKRDALLDLTHCYAIHLGDRKSAGEAVEMVYSTTTKTAMLLRASKIAALKPGEGSNDAECKAL
jgi:hypothetical protein